jgi:hypothetical protein
MGSGRNGTFDLRPHINQWALLFTSDEQIMPPSFMKLYWKFFHCRLKQFILQPIEGYGLWDGKEVFGKLQKQSSFNGPIAVLTRATIRLKRLKNFWKEVDSVATKMKSAQGFIMSYGIGEVPFIKQATFSVWKDKDSMKAFAYSMQEHAEVIRKTRNENWYREELFVRFCIISVKGFAPNIEAKMCNLQPSYEET